MVAHIESIHKEIESTEYEVKSENDGSNEDDEAA